MKERPILFNTAMVRAILDGQKTQTRRPVAKKHTQYIEYMGGSNSEETEFDFVGIGYGETTGDNGKQTAPQWFAYCTEYPEEGCVPLGQLLGAVGDRLWVRESFRLFDASDECCCSDFPCNCPRTGTPVFRATHDDGESKWKPSIHMPRSVCRIILEITNVRVERLDQISAADALAEGIQAFYGQGAEPQRFGIASENSGFGSAGSWKFCDTPAKAFYRLWDATGGKASDNPWVWVIEFKVLTTNGKIQKEAA